MLARRAAHHRPPVAEPLEVRRLLSGTVPAVGTGSAATAQLTHLPFTDQYYGPKAATAFGGRLYYLAADPSTASTVPILWSTDGTPAGTTPFATADGTHLSGGTGVAATADALYVTAGKAVDRIDGAGTVTALPLPDGDEDLNGTYTVMGTAGGRVFLFRLDVYESAVSLAGSVWASDGTVAGTADVGPFAFPAAYPDPQSPTGVAAGDAFYFETSTTLYRSDGTAAGTTAVITPEAGHGFGPLAAAGSTVYFSVDTAAFTAALYATDGTAGSVRQVIGLQPQQTFGAFAPVPDGRLYFEAYTDTAIDGPATLYVTDGTVAGTVDLGAAAGLSLPGYPNVSDSEIGVVGDRAFVVATPAGSTEADLYETDGTAAGTVPVVQLEPADGVQYVQFATDGNRVDFTIGPRPTGNPGQPTGTLYVSDGSAVGTAAVATQVPDGVLVPAAGVAFRVTDDDTGLTLGERLEFHVGPGQLLAYMVSTSAASPTTNGTAAGLAITAVADTLPAVVVTGRPARGVARVTLTATAAAYRGRTTVGVSLVPADGSGSTPIGTVRPTLRLKAGGRATVRVPLAASQVSDGSYIVRVQVTDPAGVVSLTDSGSVTVAAPSVQLTATVASVAPSPATAGRPSTLTLAVSNGGNVAATGRATFIVSLSTVGPIATVARPLTVRPGQTATVRLRVRLPALAGTRAYPTVVLTQGTSTTTGVATEPLTIGG